MPEPIDPTGLSLNERFDQLKSVAKQYDRRGQSASVAEVLSMCLEHRPDDANMWFTYGDSLRVLGRWQEAKTALMTALRKAPRSERPWISARLGMLYASQNKRATAERWFARAAKSRAGACVDWIWILRGANLASAGKLTLAEECHRHATEMEGNRDEAFHNLGLVLRAQGRYSEAIAALNEALQITEDCPEAQEALASMEDAIDAASLVRRWLGEFGERRT